MADVYEILAAHGIDKDRLGGVLAPKAENWGGLVHAFEVLTVLGAVHSAWPDRHGEEVSA